MTIDKDYPGDLRRFKDDRGDAWSIDLWYPDVEGNAKAIEIDLMDVRAADGLRIEYDKERDGWVIMQRPTCELGVGSEHWECGVGERDDWKEMCFLPAWGRKVPHEEPKR